MAKFLTTRGVSYELENIIKTAKRDVVLVTPYVRIPDVLLQRLKDADRLNKVRMILVYGKRGLEPQVQGQLQQLHNLTVLFLENLHAKCFYNEHSMLITSMNLGDFSDEHNREIGVLIQAKDDAEVFLNAIAEAESMIQSARVVSLTQTETQSQTEVTKSGHCIKCGTNVTLDPTKPFCPDCYKIWERNWDPEYVENYCHVCGKSDKTSFVKPLCRSCYEKSK